MRSRFVFTMIGLAMLCVWPVAGRQTSDVEVLFQAALHKEQVELKLDQAIADYSHIVANAGGNRTLAAKALLQMAGCYERLGRPEARQTYARIVSEYTTSAVADAARTRLAAMDQKAKGAVATKFQETDPLEFSQPDKVSRDGGYMSFLDNHNDIGIVDLSSGRRRMLTTKAGTTESWSGWSRPSPDGRFVAFDWWDSDSQEWELRVVSRDGGAPRILTKESAVGRNVPVAWSLNSKLVMAWRGNSLVYVPIDGSEVRVIKEFDRGGANNIDISPDGRFIAFSRVGATNKTERDLFSLSLETGREALMVRHEADDYFLGWIPNSDGQILFASDRGGSFGIWTSRVVNGVAQGDPLLVRRDVGRVSGYGFTKRGDFYFGIRAAHREASIATLDQATGRIVGSLTPVQGRYNGGMVGAVWSPTGDRLAYVQFVNPTAAISPGGFLQDGDNRLAIQTMATGEVRLWPHGPTEGLPTWTSDGRSVIVPPNRPGGHQELVTVNVDTGARTTIVGADPGSLGGIRPRYALAPDGRNAFFQLRQAQPASKNPAVIARRDLTTGAEQIVMPEALTYFNFSLSPDGKWLAVVRQGDPPGVSPIAIIPSSGGQRRALAVAIDDWSVAEPVAWSPDGRSVYVVKEKRDAPYEVWQVPLDGSAPRYTGINSFNQFNQISVHPDGRHLAISQAGIADEIWALKNIPLLREK